MADGNDVAEAQPAAAKDLHPLVCELELEKDQRVVTLRVPFFRQRMVNRFMSDMLCFPFSVYMVLQFYKDPYQKKEIRERLPNLTVDDLMHIFSVTPTRGWNASPSSIRDLNERVGVLSFEVKEAVDYAVIRKRLEKRLPTIIIYTPSILETGENGPWHAGVAIGMTDDKIVLNNPWYGEAAYFDLRKFDEAWETSNHMAVLVDPGFQDEFSGKAAEA